MEVESSEDIAGDKNNNPISGEVLSKEGAKQAGTHVNLNGSKRSNYLQWNSPVTFGEVANSFATVNTTGNRSLIQRKYDEGEAAPRHVRIGDEYQAVLPAFIPPGQREPEQSEHRSLQCWSPHPHEEENLVQFIRIAMEKYRYSREQGMAMLFWHKHNMYKALKDFPNFSPNPTEWDFEDKLRFEQALQIRGKSFQHIQEMLPEKSIGSLVEYYYGRTSTSTRGKNSRRLTLMKKGNAEYGSDGGEEKIKDYYSDGGQEVMHNGCAAEEEPSSSFSDWKIRNALYERHCEKNHSDLKREQRSSCPFCLKKVLNKEIENYPQGSS